MVEKRTHGRLMLIMVGLVFLGPVLLAFWLYYGSDWRPDEQTIHGHLLSPAIELPDNPLRTDSDVRLRNLWSLIVIAPADCGDACMQALYETRQVRQALGRDGDRVQRIWIVEGGEPDLHFALAEHPDLVIVDASASVGTDILRRIDARSEVDVFVVDPMGNLMMQFPTDVGMRGMHSDMKRLLKFSGTG